MFQRFFTRTQPPLAACHDTPPADFLRAEIASLDQDEKKMAERGCWQATQAFMKNDAESMENMRVTENICIYLPLLRHCCSFSPLWLKLSNRLQHIHWKNPDQRTQFIAMACEIKLTEPENAFNTRYLHQATLNPHLIGAHPSLKRYSAGHCYGYLLVWFAFLKSDRDLLTELGHIRKRRLLKQALSDAQLRLLQHIDVIQYSQGDPDFSGVYENERYEIKTTRDQAVTLCFDGDYPRKLRDYLRETVKRALRQPGKLISITIDDPVNKYAHILGLTVMPVKESYVIHFLDSTLHATTFKTALDALNNLYNVLRFSYESFINHAFYNSEANFTTQVMDVLHYPVSHCPEIAITIADTPDDTPDTPRAQRV